jgi:uncharacterized membrane protein YecN with MAPEG domain
MKRNGSAKDIVWFRAELLRLQVMNAWEEGDRIIADVMQFEEARCSPTPARRRIQRSRARALCRWTFDLPAIPTASQTYLDDITGESRASTIAARMTSHHGWYACANPDLPMFGALSASYVDGHKRLGKSAAGRRHHSEPVAARGDELRRGGGCCQRSGARENCSDLAVFNAGDVEAGPVALVHLGHRARWFPRQLGARTETLTSGLPGAYLRTGHSCVNVPILGRNITALVSITGLYLAILALLYVTRPVGRACGGQSRPVRRRRQQELRSAIRAHANFTEYVPIIALMVALLEMSDISAFRVHLLMGMLLVARLIHPLGMYVGPRTLQFQICRVGGITLTLIVLVAAALTALSRFWPQ